MAESMEMLLLSFIKAPLQCQWSISDPQAALVTTSVGIGMLIGATLWGLFADAYGRRTGFILSTFITFFAGLCSASAPNYVALLIARGITGFGIGGVPISFSILMEYTPAQYRGKFGFGLALFWSFGSMFEASVSMFVLPNLGWRALTAISALPMGVVFMMGILLPESPRWYLSKGRVSNAVDVLGKVSRLNGVPLPPGELATHDLEDPETVGRERKFGQVGELLRRGVKSLTIKIWVLWFLGALVCYGLVMLQPELISEENLGRRCHYAQRECATLGLRGNAACSANARCEWTSLGRCVPRGILETGKAERACARQLSRADFLSTFWASTGELPGIVVAFFAVEAIGRRPLLGYMFGMTALVFMSLSSCSGRGFETSTFSVGRGASSGAFQSLFLLTNEIYPSVVRTSAMGVASSVARVGLIVSPFIAQYLANYDDLAAIWTYFAAAAISVVIILLIPIETTGRALLGSMDELIAVIGDGEVKTGPSFAKDPSVNAVVRFLRWPARVDGGVVT